MGMGQGIFWGGGRRIELPPSVGSLELGGGGLGGRTAGLARHVLQHVHDGLVNKGGDPLGGEVRPGLCV